MTSKVLCFKINDEIDLMHCFWSFSDGELVESSTCANFAQAADDVKTYQYKFYSLPAILKSYYYCPSPMGE